MTTAAVRSRVSRKPRTQNLGFSERIQRALNVVDFRVRVASPAEAVDFVQSYVADERKYQLFRKFFPEEWRRSETSLVARGHYVRYSERVNEFFELVHEHLFPILTGWNEDPECDLDNFSIMSLNVDLCCDAFEMEDLCLSYCAGLLVFGDDDAALDYFIGHYGVDKDELPEINCFPFDEIWTIEKTGRAGLYLTLFEIVDHSTGNPWLDPTSCQDLELFTWNSDTLHSLAGRYAEAVGLLRQTQILDELIEADPLRVLTELIRFWNDGTLPVD